MTAESLMAKARQAAVSARVLLDTGDADGACNRAYYAMFDAARAALLASGAPVEPELARTHNGLISAFSLHLVKTRRVPIELGKALNKVEDLRLVADYKGDPIENAVAGWAVEQAEAFVHAMQSRFIPL
ncbi:MAG: HEPN domain-containing protein [Xanthomonadaceae bacterium]|nr:HEPN domain-containing protein [Xanthomonadaceae bacterium]MDP2185173.1 HEPN domain-containing protein [Xanthomonadales bacterium]